MVYPESNTHLQIASKPTHSFIYAGAFPFSCASNFRLAAKIISSLLRCKFICRSFLSALHTFFGAASFSGSSLCASFSDRLYRVIRSGCAGFAAGRADATRVRAAGAGVGMLKLGGAWCVVVSNVSISRRLVVELTVSRPRPLSTLSVVAEALPPFRCRSHAISRRLSCGNIVAIWSICAGFMRGAERAGAACAWVPDGLLRYHRDARKMTTRKTRTWGRLIDCSVMVAGRVRW